MKYNDIWSNVSHYSGDVKQISIQEIESKLAPWNDVLINNLETTESEQPYLKNLQQSISRSGIKQPLEIEEKNGKWIIMEGNHRFIVAKRIGLEQVPVLFV